MNAGSRNTRSVHCFARSHRSVTYAKRRWRRTQGREACTGLRRPHTLRLSLRLQKASSGSECITSFRLGQHNRIASMGNDCRVTQNGKLVTHLRARGRLGNPDLDRRVSFDDHKLLHDRCQKAGFSLSVAWNVHVYACGNWCICKGIPYFEIREVEDAFIMLLRDHGWKTFLRCCDRAIEDYWAWRMPPRLTGLTKRFQLRIAFERYVVQERTWHLRQERARQILGIARCAG